MAKKSAAKIPAKVAQQREGLLELGKGSNGSEALTEGKTVKQLLAEIEADAARKFEEFEREQRERREKMLAAVLEPLRKQRGEMASQRNELDIAIRKIDEQISELTGEKQRATPKEKGTRAKRKSPEQKLEIAKLVYGVLKDKGEKLGAGKLEQMTEGLKMREIAQLWNEANPKHKISKEGDKRATVYFVA